MRTFAPAFAVVAVLAILGSAPAAGQAEIFPSIDVNWTVNPAFGTASQGRNNVSGATCIASPAVARAPCLVVNDKTRFAQFFTFTGTAIRPGPFAGITPAIPPGTLAFDPNMEGAASDGRFFYVVTSRGGVGPDTSFLVARFPADPTAIPPATSLPVPTAAPVTTVPGLQVSDRIRAALGVGIPVLGFPAQQLNRENAEIEGIAVRDRVRGDSVLHLGFRAPVLSGKAIILSAPVETVFATSGPLNPTITGLALGPTVGIRDLAALSDGVLILAGPGRGLNERATLFHWNDITGQLTQLGIIAEPTNRNAEALVVLQEDPEFIRFLLMFDGLDNGGPIEYRVSR